MEAIPSYYSWTEFTIPLGLALAAAILGASYFIRSRRNKTYSGTATVITGTLFVLIAASGTLYQMIALDYERNDAITAELSDKYGVSVPSQGIFDLDYPESNPTVDFKVYGNTETKIRTDEGYSTKVISLIWDEDRLVLASSPDGQNFEFLERRD